MKREKVYILIIIFLVHFSCRNTQQASQPSDATEGIEVHEDNISLSDTNSIPSESAIEDNKKLGDNVSSNPNKVNKTKTQNPSGSDSEIKEVKPAIPPLKPESMSDAQKQKQSDQTTKIPPDPKQVIKKVNHEIYNKLLQSYVNKVGRVNYSGLKKEKSALEDYAYSLSDDPTFENGSKKEKLALWINTYNVYTLLMVVQNYPLQSVRDLHGGKPWDASWIRIGKKTYSLNQIENDIIRPQFEEPRIHFVLNCAAVSCPPLSNKIITADNLETVLESATQNFINSKENKIQESSLEISPIFDWYKQDFGDVISFLSEYSGIKIKPNAKITYKKYDWGLNGI